MRKVIILKKGKPINIKKMNLKSNKHNGVGTFETSGGALYQVRKHQLLKASSTDVTAPNRLINNRVSRRPLRLAL